MCEMETNFVATKLKIHILNEGITMCLEIN